ncbi:MAG: multiheme c-type cytochrome [Candidatus Hinthialibacter antarcticus]|nr:multiheme c-type cytochrome [Candidatus Hinthialibacter antarcticus]
MNIHRLVILFFSIALAVASMVSAAEDRVYLGEISCRECHASAVHQWRQSAHARAYVVLGMPESKEIARLSGVDVDPFESPICLGCHTTASDTEAWERDAEFSYEEGIQCEMCHGASSSYLSMHETSNSDEARQAGLFIPDERFCMVCHKEKGSHTSVIDVKPFVFSEAWKQISHSEEYGRDAELDPAWKPPQPNRNQAGAYETVEYKTPWNLTISQDGARLFVVCEASDSLMVLNTQDGAILAEIEVENQPHDVCLSPDESRIYVSNRGSDSVSELDGRSYEILRTLIVGDEPHGVMIDAANQFLYSVNAGSSDISVIELSSGEEAKRLSAARGAWAIASSPDHKTAYVTNNLSHFVGFREPSRSEVTVLDLQRGVVKDRVMVPDANLIQGADVSPDGEFALCTLIRTKNLVPMTRVLQGWVINNGFGVIWRDGRVDQLLIDGVENYFSDPTDIVFRPDGRFAYLSGGGVDAVAVIDIEKMKSVLQNASDRDRRERLPNHLGVSAEYVVKRIAVGRSPRGMVASRDGRFIYVADGLDDTVSVIDAQTQERVNVFDLGGPEVITQERWGEQIFHNARVTFGRQFSCHSCHPDGGVDGITYDIEPDGIGVQPVDNRTLRGILDTAPFKWEGTNPTLKRQCGARLAVFFTRIDPFTPEQSEALDRYICTIPRPPNRFRTGDELTPAQQRGKAMFFRTHDNSGNEIPLNDRCSTCHPAPYYTSRTVEDVGTKSPLDIHGEFDVPHLNNIYATAPYLHDGRAPTLEEIWTVFNPQDEHGVSNDMTKDQLNDLIEFLKTL